MQDSLQPCARQGRVSTVTTYCMLPSNGFNASQSLLQDNEVAAMLERMRAAGVTCEYYSADVADEGAMAAAVAQAQKQQGPITCIVHGAALQK